MNASDVVITKREGSAVGTVIATITDTENKVVDVSFYVKVLTPNATEAGPYPPDIVHRPAAGIYEKDVLLTSDYPTEVRVEVQLEDAPPIISATQTLPARTVSETGVAAGAYLPLVGGTLTGAVALGGSLDFANGKVVQAKNTAGALEFVWAPRATDNNSYYNLGSGGNLFFRDSANTIAATLSTGGLQLHGNRYATFGPNSVWGQFLKVGSGARPDNNASVFASDGNLHVDAKDTKILFLQYAGGGNTVVGYATGSNVAQYKLNVYGDSFVSGAMIVGGSSPLLFAGGGGGWYMSDASFIRAYGNKGIATVGAIRGGDVAAEAGANTAWGGARLYNGNEWGGSANVFPTLGSTANGGIIMLRRPHIPFHTDGAYVRAAVDAGANAYWDTGVYTGDRWVVARMGNAHLSGFNSGGFRFHYFAQAGDTGITDIGSMSATNWFRSTGATGWLNQTFQGGWYMSDATYVRSHGGKSVYTAGSFKCLAGFRLESTEGLLFDNGASLHATVERVITRTDKGLQLQDRTNATRGYVHFGADGFGLKDSGEQWAVRVNPGSVTLHGTVSNALGHNIPAAIVSTVAPGMNDAAAVGTVWYVTGSVAP